MKHSEIVDRAGRWLANRCAIVLTELVSGSETADAIGWDSAQSILIEAKTSHSDFKADAKKYFRHYPEMGMGQIRYYICEPGIIAPAEVPEPWGLLWCYEKIIRVQKEPETVKDYNQREEIKTLLSAVRRLGGYAAQAKEDGVSMRVKGYTKMTKGTAQLIIEGGEADD